MGRGGGAALLFLLRKSPPRPPEPHFRQNPPSTAARTPLPPREPHFRHCRTLTSVAGRSSQGFRRPFPSPIPRISAASPSPISQLDRACALVLARKDPFLPIEVALRTANFPLTPVNLSLLLSRLRSSRDALRIFLIFLKSNPNFLPDHALLDAVSRLWIHEKERFPVFLAILLDLRKPHVLMTPRRLTSVLRGYGWAGLVDDVFEFLRSCKESFGFQPDFYHFSCALHSCVEERRMDLALRVFRQMDEDGCPPNFDTFHSMIAGFLRFKQPDEAASLFVDMVKRRILCPDALPPKAISYITMVEALVSSGQLEQARNLVLGMTENGFKPDCITCTSVLKAFSHKGEVNAVDELYDEMRAKDLLPVVSDFKNFIACHCHEDISPETQKILNAMVSTFDSVTYFRASDNEEILHTEKEDCIDVASFDHVIYSLCVFEKPADAYQLMLKMTQRSGVLAETSSTFLFDALCTSSMWVEAEHVLRMMMEWKHMPNQKVFNHWIQGHCKAGHVEEVCNFLDKSNNGRLSLDDMSYNVVVDKLCLGGKLEEAKRFSREVKRNLGTPDVVTYSRMIHSFAKAGDFEVPRKLLSEMVEMGLSPFAQPFTPLVLRLCNDGKMDVALSFVDEIEAKGCKPLSSLYTAIVTAYCNAKRLPEAFRAIDNMKSKGITPEVQAHKVLFEGCMVARKPKPSDEAQVN